MKKILLSTGLFFLLFELTAQTKLGAKAGINLAALNGNGEESGALFGAHAGVFFNIMTTRNLSVQPEIVFSAEGGDGKGANIRLNYFNLPVMLQYRTLKGFYLEAGPQLGMLASAKGKFDGSSVSFDVKSGFKSFNLSAAGGLGYKMTDGFGVGLRYSLGLSNVVSGSSQDQSIKTRNFSLGLLYTFHGPRELRKRTR